MQWPPCEQAPPVNWHRCRADNFYLTKKQLRDDSPSRQAGVPAATETQLRAFGCDRVQRGVLYLRLPQAVAATGQVLLHRFYCKKSLTEFDVKVSPRQPTKVSFFSLTPGRRCDAPPPLPHCLQLVELLAAGSIIPDRRGAGCIKSANAVCSH